MDQESWTKILFSQIVRAVKCPRLTNLSLININFHALDILSFLKSCPLDRLALVDSNIDGKDYDQLVDFLKKDHGLERQKEEFRFFDTETGDEWAPSPELDKRMKGTIFRFKSRRVLPWTKEA